ncbi:acyltransferase family protein [Salidesulfovibrio onnuriiensis]|uniref:acyltransferase family protein n=1 Tax=Salidesulfovibrio onnuriiensis TaxID=2583823 RepID=UPI00202B6999|nr:acyltransferase [Salidesulfovibrio onnuriiensis]
MGIIRLLLAVAVLHSHFPIHEDLMVVDGHEAVLAFFAISGFYMALILDQTYRSRGHFYLSRFLTLYPMYVFALLLSAGLFVSLGIHPMVASAKLHAVLVDPAGFAVMAWTSLCLVGQEFLFCLAPATGGGLGMVAHSHGALWSMALLPQAWSLSLELCFYALAPFLVRLRSRQLLCLVGASLCLKLVVIALGGNEVSILRRFFPLEFWLFGLGILAYRLHRRLPGRARFYDLLAFALLVCMVIVADEVPDAIEPFFLPGATLLTMPFIFRWFRRFSWDRLVGKISYPFYLVHFSVIAVFEANFEEPLGVGILLVSLALAVLVHCLFEPGVALLKKRIGGRWAAAPVRVVS